VAGHQTLRDACVSIGAALAIGAVGAASPALAQESWQAELVDVAPVEEVRQVGSDVFVRTDRWLRAFDCDGALCFERATPPRLETPRDGIPDGTVARAAGAGVVAAWYTDPTTRYAHGILGDAIEAATLVARDDGGNTLRFEAALNRVFEDLTPRIADIDGDGFNDIVTIRSGLTTGAALAVFSIIDGELVELAATSDIGRNNRWLNVAGIADFDGNGTLDIAIVKTPHIGGTLEFWTLRGGRLTLIASVPGFSNHAIGSTEQGLSAVADVNGDGAADLAVPDDRRSTLRLVSAADGRVMVLASIPLGGEVVTAIGTMTIGGAPAFLASRSDGALVLVRPGG